MATIAAERLRSLLRERDLGEIVASEFGGLSCGGHRIGCSESRHFRFPFLVLRGMLEALGLNQLLFDSLP
jgi:hypothetical protein